MNIFYFTKKVKLISIKNKKKKNKTNKKKTDTRLFCYSLHDLLNSSTLPHFQLLFLQRVKQLHVVTCSINFLRKEADSKRVRSQPKATG